MNKIEALIKANVEKHRNFEEYFKIIEVIQNNVETNPDICIEACKSLIEGVSKTVLSNLDKTISFAELDDFKSVEKLFKTAMTKLSDACDAEFEGDFVVRYSGMIQVIGEIRNKRGDISHGRLAPKPIFSSSKLAFAVANMTECILEYVLEHYFKLNLTEKLDYYSTDLEDYNEWLNDKTDNFTAKIDFSLMLFQTSYEKYEEIYFFDYQEYLSEIESDIEYFPIEQPAASTNDEIKPKITPLMGDPAEVFKSENSDAIEPIDETPKVSIFHSSLTPFDTDAHYEKMHELLTGKHTEEKKEIVQLINDFDENTFWTKKRNAELVTFASNHNLKQPELKEFINKYYFTEKEPRRDEVEKVMIYRPPLEDRRVELLVMVEFIIELADKLKTL